MNFAVRSNNGERRFVSSLEAIKFHTKKIEKHITNMLSYNISLPPEVQKIFICIKNQDKLGILYWLSAEQIDSTNDDFRHRKTFSNYFIEYHTHMMELFRFFRCYINKNFSLIDPNYPKGKPGWGYCLLSYEPKTPIGGKNPGIYLYRNNRGEVCAIVKHHNQLEKDHLNLSKLFQKEKQRRFLSKLKFSVANECQDIELPESFAKLILDHCEHGL